ncbi:hypothetical protein [Methylophilus sp. QUAN]|uniref:hypothetical protein n=1 Tax=Methylophilus sp. QUAN TaxID=2781020 RepID=UPI00188ECD16|nr:hypothetical protein [Methylophilus sp. QUAN]MBF4990485.1 hypothetical protein [Methylophilus sp. QUAN]
MNLLAIVNQTRQRYGRVCKAYATHGLWKLGLKQWGRHAPFYRLRDELMGWNMLRLQQNGAAALNMQDISTIRRMLESAQQQSVAQLPTTLLDQWFFLAVGAVQVQSQTASNQAWHLFDQSVHSQLSTPALYRSLWFGLLVSLCVVWMAVVPVTHKQAQPELSPLESAPARQLGGTVDPVTLSLLNLAYQKMQNGSCQLPQAAMLPETQRQAFIMFVTEGKVDAEQVEPLRQALGYVSCLYPQELMRPQGRDRLPRE